MEKITLSQIQHFAKDRQGKDLITKDGRPYEKCVLIAQGGQKYYGFGNQLTKSFTKGQEVEIEVTERNGYLNFKLPPKTVTRQEFDELKLRVEGIENAIADMKRVDTTDPIEDEPTFEDMP